MTVPESTSPDSKAARELEEELPSFRFPIRHLPRSPKLPEGLPKPLPGEREFVPLPLIEHTGPPAWLTGTGAMLLSVSASLRLRAVEVHLGDRAARTPPAERSRWRSLRRRPTVRAMGMFVAFLKGMNLGRRRVKNEELCACFEDMGHGSVSAFLASGNVMFESPARSSAKLEASIEPALREWFAYEVKTFVRSAKEVAGIAEHEPFSKKQLAASTGKVQVAMLENAPSTAARKQALAFASADDLLTIEGRELYWLPKGNMSASELDMKELATCLGVMTIRTQRTLKRLTQKLTPDS